MSFTFTKSDIEKQLVDTIEIGSYEPYLIKQPLSSEGCEYTLMIGKKSDQRDVLTFWISAMSFLSRVEYCDDDFLMYREERILDVDCAPLNLNRFMDIISLAEDDPDFKFDYKPINQMLMLDEWNDILVLFETEIEYGIFNWTTDV